MKPFVSYVEERSHEAPKHLGAKNRRLAACGQRRPSCEQGSTHYTSLLSKSEEAIANRLAAIAIRLEAIAIRL